jgi:hypothetical protein
VTEKVAGDTAFRGQRYAGRLGESLNWRWPTWL